MADPALGFRLVWCDFTGLTEGFTRLLKHGQKRAARPRWNAETFATRAEAEVAQARLRAGASADFVSSIAPIVVKPAKPSPTLLGDLPRAAKRWKP